MGRDHDRVVGERDMEGWGGRTFVGVGSMDREEVAGGAGIEDCCGGMNWRGGT